MLRAITHMRIMFTRLRVREHARCTRCERRRVLISVPCVRLACRRRAVHTQDKKRYPTLVLQRRSHFSARKKERERERDKLEAMSEQDFDGEVAEPFRFNFEIAWEVANKGQYHTRTAFSGVRTRPQRIV